MKKRRDPLISANACLIPSKYSISLILKPTRKKHLKKRGSLCKNSTSWLPAIKPEQYLNSRKILRNNFSKKIRYCSSLANRHKWLNSATISCISITRWAQLTTFLFFKPEITTTMKTCLLPLNSWHSFVLQLVGIKKRKIHIIMWNLNSHHLVLPANYQSRCRSPLS